MEIKTQPKRPIRPGFTLVELLVVITIVAALAGLAFVGMAKYRERAQVANAVNSLRQIGTAHVAYATENHGAINTLRDTGEALQEGRSGRYVGDSFWGRMHPYLFATPQVNNQQNLQRQLRLMIASLFNTTNANTMTGTPWATTPIYRDGSGLPVPIGFNANLRRWNQPQVRMSAVGDPSRTIYAAYGRYFINETHGREYRPLPQEGGGSARGFYFLENGNAIVCFLDGHVETISTPIPDRRFAE